MIISKNATNREDLPLIIIIISKTNLNMAYKKVKANKGSHGIDKMSIDMMLPYLKEHGNEIKEKIIKGKYKPNPVRRVEIPKENGSKRHLGIPTVIDRLIQQAINQVLTPIYEEEFSSNSYGFRPNKSTHDAINKTKEYINDGYKYVVDMDLEKFFDKVNHSKLIEVLSRKIKDGRVISLIHKYLNAGVMIKHSYKDTTEGVPQGGNLSPLLSNIMLNELDKELELRGHKFVRYADDVMIFCKSKRAANRVLENIIPYIENKLFLKVNREKTKVDYVGKVKFLGIGYYVYKGEARIKVHKKSIEKMKSKIREITSRRTSISHELRALKLKRYVIGWVNYFKIADMTNLLKTIDSWLRRRLRQIYWKQWKKTKTKFERLTKLGIEKSKAWEYANTRKGYWRISKSPILHRTLKTQTLRNEGYLFFTDYYKSI